MPIHQILLLLRKASEASPELEPMHYTYSITQWYSPVQGIAPWPSSYAGLNTNSRMNSLRIKKHKQGNISTL